MLDLFDIQRAYLGDVQIFNRPSTVTALEWLTWQKPRGVTMAYIMCIGGGGGGGGGFTGIAGSARGGGGGGASSAIARVVIPAVLLPGKLFIQVGAGGKGVGSGGGTAGTGVPSYVAVFPYATTATNILAVSSSSLSVAGGVTGTGAAGGSGGSAPSAAAITNMPHAGLGIFNSIAGQAGVAGGAHTGADGTAITIPTTSVLCQAGSGGGGTTSADFAGGGTGIPNSYLSEQRPATPAAGSFDGSGGPQLWKPFFSFGGLGGSSSDAGVGGNGGNGAYGAGGGGGGGGTTGGRGGDGGSGIVIVVSF